MIKGVNKKIIEVNNPNSIYFEKAVFYLRTGISKLPTEVAQREIDHSFYEEMNLFRQKETRVKQFRIIIYIAIFAVLLSLFLLLL